MYATSPSPIPVSRTLASLPSLMEELPASFRNTVRSIPIRPMEAPLVTNSMKSLAQNMQSHIAQQIALHEYIHPSFLQNSNGNANPGSSLYRPGSTAFSDHSSLPPSPTRSSTFDSSSSGASQIPNGLQPNNQLHLAFHTAPSPPTIRTDFLQSSESVPTSMETCFFYRSPNPSVRQRTAQACDKCRDRKTKCSGTRPSCKRCIQRGLVCHYAPNEPRSRGNRPKSKVIEVAENDPSIPIPESSSESELPGTVKPESVARFESSNSFTALKNEDDSTPMAQQSNSTSYMPLMWSSGHDMGMPSFPSHSTLGFDSLGSQSAPQLNLIDYTTPVNPANIPFFSLDPYSSAGEYPTYASDISTPSSATSSNFPLSSNSSDAGTGFTSDTGGHGPDSDFLLGDVMGSLTDSLTREIGLITSSSVADMDPLIVTRSLSAESSSSASDGAFSSIGSSPTSGVEFLDGADFHSQYTFPQANAKDADSTFRLGDDLLSQYLNSDIDFEPSAECN